MKVINKATLQAELDKWVGGHNWFIFNTLLNRVPEIDAVEVVRCKNCKYYATAKANCKGFLICPASNMEITGNDYCSYGCRKQGNAKEKRN